MPAPVAAFFLPLIEGAATAIGAGIVIGTFGGATTGFVFRKSRKEVEGHTLRNGYYGALIAITAWVLEGRSV